MGFAWVWVVGCGENPSERLPRREGPRTSPPAQRPIDPAARSGAKPPVSRTPAVAGKPKKPQVLDLDAYVKELEAMPAREMRRRLAMVERNRPEQRSKALKGVFQKSKNGRVREAAWVYLRGDLSVFTDREILSIGRNESSSAIRALAMDQIVERHLWDGIPVLIDGMRDEQPAVRKHADQTFERLFGIKTGYEYNSTVEDRQNLRTVRPFQGDRAKGDRETAGKEGQRIPSALNSSAFEPAVYWGRSSGMESRCWLKSPVWNGACRPGR